MLLIISWLGQTGYSQSIADVARRERARQKAYESKAVFAAVGASVTTAAVSSGVTVTAKATTSSTVDTAAGVTDNKGRSEKYWRDTFAKARTDLKRAEDKLKVLDLRMNDLSAELLRQGVYTREVEVRKEIAETQTAQEQARGEVSALQQRISDLEDELRRSGGPPGWAR